MRLYQYLQQYKIPITEVEILLVEEVYEIPKLKKEKFKKLNPKTNRMKISRKTKYLKTEIPPENRTLKNLPKYADKISRVRFQDWLEMKQDSDFSKKGASGGKGCDGKWYGYSHRAIFGFKKGHVVKNNDHIGRDTKRKTPYTIKSDNDAKQHAIRFSREVS